MLFQTKEQKKRVDDTKKAESQNGVSGRVKNAGLNWKDLPFDMKIYYKTYNFIELITWKGLYLLLVSALRRNLLAVIRWYPRTRNFFYVITGPKLHKALHRERMKVCDTCDKKVDNLKRRWYYLWFKKSLRWYCSAKTCNCPNWFMSDLNVKNKYVRISCPEKKFSGDKESNITVETIKQTPNCVSCGN